MTAQAASSEVPLTTPGQTVDAHAQPLRPDMVASAIAPDYALGAHTGSLGLAFSTGSLFPAKYSGGAFVGQHGSWNREPPSGYKVIFVPFTDGAPTGAPQDILSGFLDADGDAMGVGVVRPHRGAAGCRRCGNKVWRVVPETPQP